MLKPEKFMGGEIRFITEASNQLMPDKTTRSWERSVKIISGKKEIKVGQSFFDKIVALADREDVQEFIKDLE